ncbi:MAG: hypothetical protein NC338_01055 [Firmicutes bacterium]|nr:hypothetical protein [Bacillota bacterium]MCM1400384.1 hypothetical protein [Bacteroides sp.]MCM1477141.1 hypothetical protein [Bacteroides sp.]
MGNKLKYHSEDDRCYGATGMTVAFVVLDGDNLIAGVDLDASPDALISYSDEYFFSGNPGLSAKSAWNTILKHFNFSMAAAMANVMCRSYVLDNRQLDPETKQLLLDHILLEGRDECNLDDDETRRLFDKNYVYLTRVFTHQGVQSVCHDFAGALKRRRRMSRLEILEQLRALQML